VYNDFQIETPDNTEVLVAHYRYEDYSGDAYVLFRDTETGQLYEVEGGHCSCNGLEGQWSPGEVTVDYLRNRVEKGHFGDGDSDIKKAVQDVIASYNN
jgi:hypothetical protein